MTTWDENAPGVMVLPSGLTVRGRGLRNGLPAGPQPSYGVYLLGRQPPEVAWESRWLRWPDFRLPADPDEARRVFAQALERAGSERVEFACGGGRGRTGTALACLAALDGIPAAQAVTSSDDTTTATQWKPPGRNATYDASAANPVDRQPRSRVCSAA